MKRILSKVWLAVFLVSMLMPVIAFGEEVVSSTAVTASGSAVAATEAAVAVSLQAVAVTQAPVINTGDTAWILTSSALVLLMTVPALALFYGGMVRKKNILSTFYYSLSAAIVVSILWVVVQYSMAFGGKDFGGGILGGLDKAFLNGVGMGTVYATAPTIPEFVFLAFQLTFAIITVALISGALVERLNFGAWILFVIGWSLLVYGPLAHWVWNPDGWLFKLGALDFAGGLVVHISSGVSAMVAALFIGERVRYKKDAIVPSNIPYVFIGASLLWVGWFGFNAGSAVSAGPLAGSAFIVTNTAAAVAAMTWMVIEWIVHKKPTVIGAASGLVAGLVAITPAAGFVDVKAAIIIGIVVSLLCYTMVAKVKKAFGYDDSLDAFGIHGIGGTWGAIATGIFANPEVNPLGKGLLYGNPNQLVIQLISVGVAYAIAIIGTLVVLFLVKLVTKLRVEPQEEIFGLDLSLHGETVGD